MLMGNIHLRELVVVVQGIERIGIVHVELGQPGD